MRDGSGLLADDGVRDLAGCTVERVCVAGQARRATEVRSPTAREARPEDGTARRRAPAGDPYGAEGKPVPGRGPPEGQGAPCGQGDPGGQEPGAPLDAGARAAGAGAAGASPRRPEPQRGRIRTERPDELWGPDASRFWTTAEGWCWFFAAVDHCASDVVGWHVAKKGDRWAALEPVR